jgi:hypothetical protein
LREIGGVLGGSKAGVSSLGRRRNGSLDSIHWLTHDCGIEENGVQNGLERDIWGVVESQSCNDAVRSVCCTRCEILIMALTDRERCLNLVFLSDGRVENEKDRDERKWGTVS